MKPPQAKDKHSQTGGVDDIPGIGAHEAREEREDRTRDRGGQPGRASKVGRHCRTVAEAFRCDDREADDAEPEARAQGGVACQRPRWSAACGAGPAVGDVVGDRRGGWAARG